MCFVREGIFCCYGAIPVIYAKLRKCFIMTKFVRCVWQCFVGYREIAYGILQCDCVKQNNLALLSLEEESARLMVMRNDW